MKAFVGDGIFDAHGFRKTHRKTDFVGADANIRPVFQNNL